MISAFQFVPENLHFLGIRVALSVLDKSRYESVCIIVVIG
jgi:hypothetical protein